MNCQFCGFSSQLIFIGSSASAVVQPLSDQNLVNRAFCGKSMKLGTYVHHTKPSKFSYNAKPDFPRGGFGAHLKKWPLCHHISETIGIEPSFSTLHCIKIIQVFWGVDFRKGIAEYIMPLYPPFKQNGGHFQRKRPISETKRRRVSILTLCLCFVGHIFHRKYCRIHHASASIILEAILKTWRPFPK